MAGIDPEIEVVLNKSIAFVYSENLAAFFNVLEPFWDLVLSIRSQIVQNKTRKMTTAKNDLKMEYLIG